MAPCSQENLLKSLFSTSQYRSATTPGEFRCNIRSRFEFLLLPFRWCWDKDNQRQSAFRLGLSLKAAKRQAPCKSLSGPSGPKYPENVSGVSGTPLRHSGDTPWDTLPDTPSGTLLGTLLGTLRPRRARETPAGGRALTNLKVFSLSMPW